MFITYYSVYKTQLMSGISPSEHKSEVVRGLCVLGNLSAFFFVLEAILTLDESK